MWAAGWHGERKGSDEEEASHSQRGWAGGGAGVELIRLSWQQGSSSH